MAPLWAWASLVGSPGIPPSPTSSPWTSQLSLQAPNICLPHNCREGGRVLKAANRFWKRQESKMSLGGKQPSVTPGPAWHGHQLSPPSSLPDWPSLQVVFLIKGDASYWVPAGPFKEHSDVIAADYYWIPHKPLSESIVSHLLSSGEPLWKETLGLVLSHQQSWLKSFETSSSSKWES